MAADCHPPDETAEPGGKSPLLAFPPRPLTMKRIAIIGGGISGLSAAFRLQQQKEQGVPLEYALLESSSRLGGVLQTERFEDCILEAGPDSFLSEKKEAADLCRELGLADQLIASNDGARKTYILVKNRLVAMPDGLMFMVPTKVFPTMASPLFSAGTKLRMAREWFYAKQAKGPDESIASLLERHYGREVVDRLADPLLSGVYGSPASELSVRAVLPRFARMEEEHGSLGRGMLAAGKVRQEKTPQSTRSLFTSLAGGMQQMVDALVQRLAKSALRTGNPVESVQRADDGWWLASGGRAERFDAVILATPARQAAALLLPTSQAFSAELAQFRSTSSVIVNLVYDQIVRTQLPPGFGFLVPRSEGRRVLAVTFVHNKFKGRVPSHRALLRCFLGGAGNDAILDLPDDEMIRLVRDELRLTLGISADPLFTRVYRWKSAMAQYGVGHLDRLGRIAILRENLPGLALAGNTYGGIGIPDCVRSGNIAAAESLHALGFSQPASQLPPAGQTSPVPA
jgi:oxygen-dependent protoporphyrinogen oxidase